MTTAILICFVILSCSVSIIMVWYVRQLIQKFRTAILNSNLVLGSVGEYHTHLQTVYELEAYFGDPTIEGLIKHTSDLLEEVKTYQQLFYTVQGQENKEVQEGQ